MPPTKRARADSRQRDTRARRRGFEQEIELPPPSELAEYVDAVVAHPKYLAELAEIETPQGPAPFKLWPFQLELLDLALSERRLIVLKSRQLGVTWTLGSLLGLWDCIAYPAGQDLVVSINEDDAKAVVERAKFIYESTPDWFQVVFPPANSNTSQIAIAHDTGNRVTASKLISLSASGNAGRSRTFRRVMADESARWENAQSRMTSLRPTVADSGSLIQMSTAEGINHFCHTFRGAADPGAEPTAEGNDYVRVFLGADVHPGRDAAWISAEREALGEDGPQEYPLTANEAFIASGNCIFDSDGLQDQVDLAVGQPIERVDLLEPAENVILPDPQVLGGWRIWRHPEVGRRYLISADVCGGVRGGDFSYAVVFDRDSWDQVAAFHGQPDPEEFGQILDLAGRYYSDDGRPALLAPESNNHGQGVIAMLKQARYTHIWRDDLSQTVGNSVKSTLGWTTNAKTRPLAISALQQAIREGTIAVRDDAAIGEMLAFIRNPNGRFEAEEGAHDDRVMAFAIGAAILLHSRRSARQSSPAERRVRQARITKYEPRVSAKTGY